MLNKESEEIIRKYQKTAISKNQPVTVFLTSSNRSEFIYHAISSILNQDYNNFCFVILDNFSDDGTEEIIKSFKDERMFFLQRTSTLEKPNFMFAFSICVTEYIVIFHDDDIVEKNYLSVMLPVIEQSDIQLLSPSSNILNQSGKIIRKPLNPSRIYLNDSYLKSFIKRDKKMAILCFPANMYQTNFYRNMNDYLKAVEAGPASDQYLILQTERNGGKIQVIPDRLINYRVHKNQSSSQMSGMMELQLIRFLMQDNYYKEKIIKYKKYFYKYLLSAYKALAINYSRNRDESVRNCLKMEKNFYSGLGWKCRMVCLAYNISYYFFSITIAPYAAWLRWKRKDE